MTLISDDILPKVYIRQIYLVFVGCVFLLLLHVSGNIFPISR